MVSFLQSTQPDIKSINKDFQLIRDQKINITDVRRCADALKDNASPGDDGFIGGFYKCFQESLAPFFAGLFEESLGKEERNRPPL